MQKKLFKAIMLFFCLHSYLIVLASDSARGTNDSLPPSAVAVQNLNLSLDVPVFWPRGYSTDREDLFNASGVFVYQNGQKLKSCLSARSRLVVPISEFQRDFDSFLPHSVADGGERSNPDVSSQRADVELTSKKKKNVVFHSDCKTEDGPPLSRKKQQKFRVVLMSYAYVQSSNSLGSAQRVESFSPDEDQPGLDTFGVEENQFVGDVDATTVEEDPLDRSQAFGQLFNPNGGISSCGLGKSSSSGSFEKNDQDYRLPDDLPNLSVPHPISAHQQAQLSIVDEPESSLTRTVLSVASLEDLESQTNPVVRDDQQAALRVADEPEARLPEIVVRPIMTMASEVKVNPLVQESEKSWILSALQTVFCCNCCCD